MKRRSPRHKSHPPLSDADRALFIEAVERLPAHREGPAGLVQEAPPAPKAKKRERESEAKLDLHGQTREQAIFQLRAFIDRCVSLNKRRMLVVHGKGSGALRHEVRRFLAQHTRVLSIIEAPARLGGEGAVLVELELG